MPPKPIGAHKPSLNFWENIGLDFVGTLLEFPVNCADP